MWWIYETLNFSVRKIWLANVFFIIMVRVVCTNFKSVRKRLISMWVSSSRPQVGYKNSNDRATIFYGQRTPFFFMALHWRREKKLQNPLLCGIFSPAKTIPFHRPNNFTWNRICIRQVLPMHSQNSHQKVIKNPSFSWKLGIHSKKLKFHFWSKSKHSLYSFKNEIFL